MHKFLSGSGWKSDTFIVAKKRLIPAERRDVTVDMQVTTIGVPLVF
jgi:hypothetical protein